MPLGDRTGPTGMGPMTGRGSGWCGYGLGRNRWWGRGRGFGRYFNAQAEPGQKDIETYVQALKEELEEAEKLLK